MYITLEFTCFVGSFGNDFPPNIIAYLRAEPGRAEPSLILFWTSRAEPDSFLDEPSPARAWSQRAEPSPSLELRLVQAYTFNIICKKLYFNRFLPTWRI